MRRKKVKDRVTSLFKKYIVKRPNGQCQILFSLTELDGFVNEIFIELFDEEYLKLQNKSEEHF